MNYILHVQKLLYTQIVCRSCAIGNVNILVFLKVIETISVYSANTEWNSSVKCLWNETECNESTEVQTLGVIRIQLIYSINVLSKYSSLISHRPSIYEGRHIDHRSSKIDTSITDLRRSTRRSSIFDGQHIDLRRSTHRSSKIDTS